MSKDKFCPLTEAKCVRQDCVCYKVSSEKIGSETIERPYCVYFRVYLEEVEL